MPTLDTSKFDLSTAIPVAENAGKPVKRPSFDLTSAAPVADLGNGMTPFEAFQKDGSGDLKDAISAPISYGHAEYIQNASKDPWYHGIQEGWEALRRPIVEGVVGFGTRPFGRNIDTQTGEIVKGQNPDEYKKFVMKEHPIMGAAGSLIGGFAPFIAAAPFLPETLLGIFAINAGIGGVNAIGNVGMRKATESLMLRNPDQADQMGQDVASVAKEAALWGTIGAWGKTVNGMKIAADSVAPGATAFEAFAQKTYAAFQKASLSGTGAAAASNLAGYNLEDSFKNGAFIFALHNIASVPENAKTALGRGILNGLANRLNEAYANGELKVAGAEAQGTSAGPAKQPFTVDVDKWDAAMTRTKVTYLLRAIYTLTKPRIDKMAAGDPVFNPETGTSTPWLESPWAGVVAHPAYEIKPEPPKGPVFYSRMVEVLKDKMPNNAAPDQVMGIIKSAGISPDEVGLSGIEDHLAGQDKVKKEDLVKFLQDNQTQVGETVKSHDTRFGMYQVRRFVDGQDMGPVVVDQIFNNSVAAQDQADKFAAMNKPTWRGMKIEYKAVMKEDTKYHGETTTLPGGENYREILQTIDTDLKTADPKVEVKHNPDANEYPYDVYINGEHMQGYNKKPLQAWIDADIQEWKDEQNKTRKYKSPHWDEKNVISHMRVDDRVSGSGDKVLMVQETQSDWNRELKAGKTKASHPLVGKWMDLILKRALHLAAQEGHDYVAFISGKQTADRYDLSKQIKSVEVAKRPTGKLIVFMRTLDGQRVNAPETADIDPKDLPGIVGKDLAEKIVKDTEKLDPIGEGGVTEDKLIKYEGQDLKVGGEWAANLYDQMIPAWLEKYGKRFGAKPEYINVPLPGEPDNMQLAMRITPALRAFLTEKGNPLFGTPQAAKNGTMYEQQGEMDFNAPQGLSISEEEINKNAPYPWTGISDLKSVDDKMAEIVPEAFKVFGRSSDITPEQEKLIKQYLAEALAGLDTDLIYDDLSVFLDSIYAIDRPDLNGKIMGAFEKRRLMLTIAKDSKHTAAHEVGHYLDNKWAREFGIADESLSSLEWDMVNGDKAHMAWASEFRSFVDTLVGKSSDQKVGPDAGYIKDPAEVFARFVARFVDWTRAQADKTAFHEPYYADRFQESDYLQFVRILQEKAALNRAKGIQPTVDNHGKTVQYEVAPGEPAPKNELSKENVDAVAKEQGITPEEAAKAIKITQDKLANDLNPSDYKKIIKDKTGMNKAPGQKMSMGQLMRDRVKVSKEAFKAGREDVFNTIVKDLKWEKANTVDIKKQIADYAKAYLPQAIRAKAIPMITNAKNQDDLIKAFVRINNMGEEYEKKVLIAETKYILKEIMDAQNIDIKEIDKAKKAVAGLDFTTHKPETMDRIEKMKAAIEKAQANGEPIEVTEKMAKELAMLDKDSVREMSIRNIQAIKAQLEVLRDLGKKKLKSRQNIRQLRKEIIAEKILTGIQNIDKVNLPQRKAGEKWTSAQYFRQFILQRQKGLQRLDLALTQMDVFFDLLDGGNGTFDGPCFKHFKATTDLNYQAYMGIKDDQQKPLVDLATKLELNGYNFERIGVYAASQQEDGMDKLAGMGYSEEEVASYVLDAKEMEWYNAARSAFDSLHPVLEKFMHEEFNQPLGQVKNYFSFMTDFDAMDDAEVAARFAEQSEYSRAKKTPEKGFTEKRVGGSQKIQLNAYRIAMRHLDNVAYLLSMTHDNRVLFEIANSPKFKESAGEMGTAFTIDWLDTIARKGGAEGQKRIDWLDVLRRNIGVSTLGFKDTTILIQFSSILDAGSYIGNYAFKGIADIQDPAWAAFVMAMPEIKHREGDDPAFHEVDPDKVMPMFAWYADFQKKGMLPIQKVDMLSAMAVAAGAYQKYMIEHGLTIDLSKPNPQAMEYAQRIVRRSQGSSFFKDAPQAGVRGKITGNRSVDKALLQFQNFMIAVRWNTIRNEVWRNGIKAGNYKDALGKAYWLMLSSLYGIGMMYGLSKLKDLLTGADTKFDAGKKLISEAFNQIPLIGSLMGEVATGQQPGMPAPVIDTLVQTGKDVGYMVSSKRPEAKGKAAVRTAMDSARMGGVPGTAMASNLVNRAMKPKKSGIQGVKIQGVKLSGVKVQGVKLQ